LTNQPTGGGGSLAVVAEQRRRWQQLGGSSCCGSLVAAAARAGGLVIVELSMAVFIDAQVDVLLARQISVQISTHVGDVNSHNQNKSW
jgi:hypothetical protein